jgi:hypothetical protein
MDAEHRGEVLCLGNPLTGSGFAVGDRASDLGGDLLVQIDLVGAIDRSERQCRLAVIGVA